MLKRKRILLLAALFSAWSLLSVEVSAESVNPIKVSVDNQVISGNVHAVYSDGSILVPAKEFSQALGGTFKYDPAAMTGTVRQGENELVFRLDNNIVSYNGKYIQAQAPMKIIGYRVMIPAEFTAKNVGAESYMRTSNNNLMIFKSNDGKLIYNVVSGDTLWIISKLFSTSISSIKQLNGLTNDNISVGQKLIIKNFTPFNPIIPAYTSKSATLSSGPGFSYSAVNYLAAWSAFSIVGKTGDWYKAVTSKGNGYIHNSVTYIKQDISNNTANSKFFEGNIPVDTSKDSVTYNTYTVKSGDSIWSISLNVGVSDYELAAANGVQPTTVLYPGQILKVPVHNIPVKITPDAQYGEILDWFKEGQYVFPIGKEGKLVDLETGKSFLVKRTMGASHSDTETLTLQDTESMKSVFGGSWSWNRRPFILEADGRRYAVSVSGMPHAGVDGAAFLKNVDNRSGNWGSGPNYDSISGNGMDGHFDVYFLNCLRHVDNKIDPQHQSWVMIAGGLQ